MKIKDASVFTNKLTWLPQTHTSTCTKASGTQAREHTYTHAEVHMQKTSSMSTHTHTHTCPLGKPYTITARMGFILSLQQLINCILQIVRFSRKHWWGTARMGALGEACIFLACVQNLLTYHIQYTACIFHMGAWGGMTRVYFVSYGGHVGKPIGQRFFAHIRFQSAYTAM